MYTVGPRSVRVISRESATPPLLGAAAWFPGMPMRVQSSLGLVRTAQVGGGLGAGWYGSGPQGRGYQQDGLPRGRQVHGA